MEVLDAPSGPRQIGKRARGYRYTGHVVADRELEARTGIHRSECVPGADLAIGATVGLL